MTLFIEMKKWIFDNSEVKRFYCAEQVFRNSCTPNFYACFFYVIIVLSVNAEQQFMVYRTDSELIFLSLKWFRITHISIHQNNKGLHPYFDHFQARDSFYSSRHVFHEFGTVNINFYTQLNRSVIYFFGLIFFFF